MVVDGKLITSRGPGAVICLPGLAQSVAGLGTRKSMVLAGTAFQFSLQLVESLFGAEKAKEVAGPMVM